jgi:hypothetical protein
MAELEQETIERAMRWCAEAGRQTTPDEVRAALGSLGWDQLLTVRALLAASPPARPLGPHALADLGRGVPVDVAAERERQERYPRPVPAPSPGAPAAPPASVTAAPKKRETKASRRTRRGQIVVRKVVASRPTMAIEPPRLPLLEELFLPAGRGELERLIRTHGGRRPRLVETIAMTHRRADGAPVGDVDLDAALEHHGLDRAFARRERDELRHAVRAAGGVLAQAAAALGHDLASLGAAIARLALDADVKRLRDARRRDLRSRATLSERALLLVGSADKMADLELLEEFELDLKARLPEHLRALSTTGEPLELGLARTLSLPGASVRLLLERLGVDLRAAIAPSRPAASEPPQAGPRSTARSHGRPGGARPPSRRPAGVGPKIDRPAGSRPASRRPSAPRPPGSRPTGSRPTTGRPAGSRLLEPRASPARPYAKRRQGPRPSGPRAAGARPALARPSGPRRPSPGGGRRRPPR